MRTTFLLRAVVPTTAALALMLTACGPDQSGGDSAGTAPSSAPASASAASSPGADFGGRTDGTSTSAPTITASTSVPSPAGSSPGATTGSRFPGALAVGAKAQGTYTDHEKGDISVGIALTGVVKGDVADLAKFFKPDELAGKTPYYVNVTYTHTGGNGIYEPYFNLQLRAMVSDTDQARKVDLLSAFPKCESDVPQGGKDFVKGQSEHECAIYLAPADKPLTYLLWIDKSGTPLAWKAS
ncbi:hypothetical protein ABZW30_33805 [Kitasatospora sp. NPDC004669]|uniref:hypothetical protein n=1 Tax=Kitasatospora sp. NPDC004669 TaxID=3154555 RepID=UPI0033BD3212